MELKVIVSVNQNVDNLTKEQKYDQLFAKAFQALKEAGKLNTNIVSESAGTFHTIDEYFAHLEELFILDNSYIMLPLDEVPFDIDANKRTISNPKITVMQKDQNAEVVIFTIDRYFDYKDLTTAQIYVQWTLPDGKEGASRIEMTDLSIPGKIRFGWPLDNEITSQEGAVKFSVRFWNKETLKDEYGNDKETVVYSFNTQTSTLNITKSLQPEINEGINVNAPISEGFFRKAIRNSNIATENIAIPLDPNFGLPGLNLDPYASLTGNELTLEAQAIYQDTGEISYRWYYRPAVDIEANGVSFKANVWYPYDEEYQEEVLGENGKPTEEFVTKKGFYALGGLVEDSYKRVGKTVSSNTYKENDESSNVKTLVFGEKYYVKVGEEYIPFAGGIGQEIYERFTTYTVPPSGTVTGTYRVGAVNTLRDNKSKEIPSQECNLVSPEDIALKDNGNLPKKEVLDTANEVLEIKLIPDSNLSVQRSFTWSKSTTNENSDFINLTSNVDGSKCDIGAEGPGWYKVHVDSTLNRETKQLDSLVCKVTNPPLKPRRLPRWEKDSKIAPLSGDEIAITVNYTNDILEDMAETKPEAPSFDITANGDGSKEAELKVVVDYANIPADHSRLLYSEDITYNWYVQETDSINFRLLTEDDVQENGLVVSGLNTPILKVRVLTDELNKSYATYKCVITNHLNGEKASSELNPANNDSLIHAALDFIVY